MKNRSLEILTLAIFSVLLVGAKILPVKAAPSSKNTKTDTEKKLGDTKLLEDTPLFESKKFQIAFITALSMTGVAILVGTGKSIKYDNSQEKKTDDSQEKEVSQLTKTEINDASLTTSDQNKLVNKTSEGSDILIGQTKPVNGSQQWLLDDPNADYRKIYQNLQQQVYQSPDFANNPTWEADSWEVDVEIAITILSRSPNNFEQVKQVLLESDRVREWKKTLPQEGYQVETSEYIEKAYNWAQDLQKWRKQKTNNSELSSK